MWLFQKVWETRRVPSVDVAVKFSSFFGFCFSANVFSQLYVEFTTVYEQEHFGNLVTFGEHW